MILATRKSDGIMVSLEWNHSDVAVIVNEPSGHDVIVPVPADRAMDAFWHPYAYAAAAGISYTYADRNV